MSLDSPRISLNHKWVSALNSSLDTVSFRYKSLLNSGAASYFQDNSLNKEKIKKKIAQNRLIKLQQDLENTKKKGQTILTFKHKLLSQVQLFQYIKTQQRALLTQQEQMVQAAVRIQKIARGFLVRKKLTKVFVEIYKSRVKDQIKNIEKINNFCLFFVGKRAKSAVVTIQRFIRRRLLRKKLAKMLKYYEEVLIVRELEIAKKLKPIFNILFNRSLLLPVKSQLSQYKKLKSIREKLAILTIKKVLKNKRIKIKSIKHRIRRYLAKPTQALLNSHPNLMPSESNVSHQFKVEYPAVQFKPNDTFSNSSEYLAVQEAIKKEKVSKGKISYNIHQKHPVLILPLFQDYDPDSRPGTTRSIMNKSNLVNPLRSIPAPTTPQKPKNRKKSSFPSKSYQYKLKPQLPDDEPSYMKDTFTSIMRYEETPSPEPSVSKKISAEEKYFNPTFSFIQKIKNFSQTDPPKFTASRPSTGPYFTRRNVKIKQKSCAYIQEFPFEPPDSIENNVCSFRPFLSTVKPSLSYKSSRSRYLSC